MFHCVENVNIVLANGVDSETELVLSLCLELWWGVNAVIFRDDRCCVVSVRDCCIM